MALILELDGTSLDVFLWVFQVNEGVREKENSDRLEWIQAHVQCEGLSEVHLILLMPSENKAT